MRLCNSPSSVRYVMAIAWLSIDLPIIIHIAIQYCFDKLQLSKTFPGTVVITRD